MPPAAGGGAKVARKGVDPGTAADHPVTGIPALWRFLPRRWSAASQLWSKRGTRSEGAHLVPASHTRRHASTCQMGLTAQIFMRTEPEDSASSRNWKSLPAYRRRQRSKTHLANRRRKRLLQPRVSAERQRLSVRERAPWGVLLDRIGDRRARPRSWRTARRAGTTAAM